MNTIYSIGYAGKSIQTFIEQLQKHQISAVADVRSVPYSAAFADYHQEALQQHLQRAGIRYVYLGNELGPRSKNKEHYNAEGQIDFHKLSQSPGFKKGLQRLENGLTLGWNIALMCAEKDPACCHRSLLIAYFSSRQNASFIVEHIDHKGRLEPQEGLEERLLELQSLGQDLLMSHDQAKRQAYQQQCQQTSYFHPDLTRD